MLHAIVGHTYTKYTDKIHIYTDAQIHKLYTQLHKVNSLETKMQRVLQNKRGRREMRKKRKAVKEIGHYVRCGNSIVYRNSKWWGSIIWWYRTILFSKWWKVTIWWMSTIWWRSIIWWKVTIIFDAIALEMACRPVRVQTGEWKVVLRKLLE